jgi:hypothetical protein
LNQAETPAWEYMHINYTGSFHSGGYHFHFRQQGEGMLRNNTVGITRAKDPRNDIYIRTDRSGKAIIRTCRHEVLHHYFPNYKHQDDVSRWDDPIYMLEDNVEFATCKYMMQKIQRLS